MCVYTQSHSFNIILLFCLYPFLIKTFLCTGQWRSKELQKCMITPCYVCTLTSVPISFVFFHSNLNQTFDQWEWMVKLKKLLKGICLGFNSGTHCQSVSNCHSYRIMCNVLLFIICMQMNSYRNVRFLIIDGNTMIFIFFDHDTNLGQSWQCGKIQ